MHYRALGETGLRVSEIGFGCGDNAGLFVRGSRDEQCRILERALELGINYFDTSPAYGKGLSETNLGETLRAVGAKPYITTKVEIMPEHLGDIAGRVISSVHESLERLRLDSVDIIQIHNPPCLERNLDVEGWIHLSVEDYLGPNGALEGLERIRREGSCRYVGFACEHADAAAVRPLLATGAFQMLNVWYDLLNPTAGVRRPEELIVGDDYDGILNDVPSYKVGTAIIRPLAGGALTDAAIAGAGRHAMAGGALTRNPEGYAEMMEQAQVMRFLSQPGLHSLSQAAVRFILMHGGVTTVLGGFSDIQQLDDMASCSGAGDLSEENLARLQAVWRSNCGRWERQSWTAAG